MIARLRTTVDTLDARLNGSADAHAARRGWTVERTGWLGLSRRYADPRWLARADTTEPGLADGGRTGTYAENSRTGQTGRKKTWREQDSASGPRHSTQGE